MKNFSYLIFHLNLAFSSIPAEKRALVIEKCYWPLLQIISDIKIPIGIELTGWTLKQINDISPEWVKEFSKLLHNNKCELIGSGYSQIIGPLVPYEVNKWNQNLGIISYQEILNISPKIALVNEMAFSSSLVDIYKSSGYEAIIMDRDNARLALYIEENPLYKMPIYAKGVNNSSLSVLWGDSILFQKLQHLCHGDISENEYLNYIKKRINEGEKVLPLYCNDAETFDFRPGRFAEELEKNHEGEWLIMRNTLTRLQSELNIDFISPSQALKKNINDELSLKDPAFLSSASYPVPVKKQSKYNIGRWAVTGKDDVWLNVMCHRIHQHLKENNISDDEDWKTLCELWASDLRTHITENRWDSAVSKIMSQLDKYNLSNQYGYKPSKDNSAINIENIENFEINLINDGLHLSIANENLQCVLNLRKGLSIERLSFKSHDYIPCIGTIKHGYLNSINQGADFFTGGTIMEFPNKIKRLTDLSPISPVISQEDNGDICIIVKIIGQFASINKKISISQKNEKISISYDFPNTPRIPSSLRVGNITFFPEFFDSPIKYSFLSGGLYKEEFTIDSNFDHGANGSSIVTSSRGFSPTDGHFDIYDNNKGISLNWDLKQAAPLCLLHNKNSLLRASFALSEIDESFRDSSKFPSLEFHVMPLKKII